MKVLSFDVGIKNLAYCLLDYTNNGFIIDKWDIINLCGEVPTCNFKNKNKCCNNKAKFHKNNIYTCKTHAKSYEYILPSSNILPKGLSIKKINNCKVGLLKEFASQFNINVSECTNKTEILCKLNDFIQDKFWEQISINKADNIDLISLGRTMKQQFDNLFVEIPDVVLIENQISPIANRMKTLQGMIAQYFIDRNTNKIIFVSASNKLKEFHGGSKTRTSYAERKKKSIEITTDEILKLNNTQKNWYEFFNKHTKNDDLADSFLQALWFIKHSDIK